MLQVETRSMLGMGREERIRAIQQTLDRIKAGIVEDVPGQPGVRRAVPIDPNTNPLIQEAIDQAAIERNRARK